MQPNASPPNFLTAANAAVRGRALPDTAPVTSAITAPITAPSATQITTQLVKQFSLVDLQTEWCELLGRAEHSFFLSWTWIGTWLASLPTALQPQLMRARCGGHTVGLALLGSCQAVRHGIIRSSGLHLNSTGDDAFDDITIEYNALLIDKALHHAVQNAMWTHVVKDMSGWDECHLPGMTHLANELKTAAGTRLRQRTSTTFQVQLRALCSDLAANAEPAHATDQVRAEALSQPVDAASTPSSPPSSAPSSNPSGDIEAYLAVLGQKPRYHIRRSLRQYALLGPLNLEVAHTVEQAQAIMAELQTLHSAYWASKGRPGAFLNPYVVSFHQQMIATAFERGEVQLLRLSAGDKVISCMYNFVYRGTIYHYQSGINYTLFDGQDSPGLVSHAMAVSLNAAAGHRVYDFMAGDQQYKRSLCTDTGELHWLVLQRTRLQFSLEDLLRRAKRRLVPRSSA